MAVQAGEGLPAPRPAPDRTDAAPPLVVVVSQRTVEVLRDIVSGGWTGPVVVVGSVREAQQVVESHPTPAPTTPGPPLPRRVWQAQPAVEGAVPALALDRNRQLLVCEGRECALTPLEFGVLDALTEQVGEVRRFADLTRRVWGSAHVGDGGQVHAVVRRVRRKLELVGAPVDLLAVRGVGFRLVGRQPSRRPSQISAPPPSQTPAAHPSQTPAPHASPARLVVAE